MFDKKYLFLKEELMLKTKVLKLEPSCRIINKTNFNFGLKFKRSLTDIPIRSPNKNLQSENDSEMKGKSLSKFTLIDN